MKVVLQAASTEYYSTWSEVEEWRSRIEDQAYGWKSAWAYNQLGWTSLSLKFHKCFKLFYTRPDIITNTVLKIRMYEVLYRYLLLVIVLYELSICHVAWWKSSWETKSTKVTITTDHHCRTIGSKTVQGNGRHLRPSLCLYIVGQMHHRVCALLLESFLTIIPFY